MAERLYIVLTEPHAWTARMKFSPDGAFPWDHVSVAPPIDQRYTLDIHWKRMKRLTVDYFGNEIVSERFKVMCDQQKVDCQFVPLDIILNDVPVEENFSFILLNEFVSIVDMQKTPHVKRRTRDGKSYSMSSYFSGVPEYGLLEHIVFNDSPKPPFFIAPEIGGKRVCTEAFKDSAEANNFERIKFVPIDDDYKYEALGWQPRWAYDESGDRFTIIEQSQLIGERGKDGSPETAK